MSSERVPRAWVSRTGSQVLVHDVSVCARRGRGLLDTLDARMFHSTWDMAAILDTLPCVYSKQNTHLPIPCAMMRHGGMAMRHGYLDLVTSYYRPQTTVHTPLR